MKHLKVTSALLSAIMSMSMLMTPVAVLADETEVPSETQTTESAEENEKADENDAETEEPEVLEDKGEIDAEAHREAEDAYLAKGKCGKKVKWTLDKKGTLKITGKGAMKNYKNVGTYKSNAPWIKHHSKIKKVVISKGVTTVGACAFVNCENLAGVSLPKSLKSINNSAFSNCISLKAVSIPKKVTVIGAGAFAYCTALEKVNIPNGVKTISQFAFTKTAIKSISFPKSVNTIGMSAFFECNALTSVTIPATVKTIEKEAFSSCTNLETLKIPIAGLVKLGDLAFSDCRSLKETQVPLSVKELGYGVFSSCTSLELAFIDYNLYVNSKLLFYNCPNKTVRYFDYAPVDHVFTQGNFVYKVTFPEVDGTGTVSVIGYDPNIEKLVIPSGVSLENKGLTVNYKVTGIESNGFLGSSWNNILKSVVLGSNITSIADNAFKDCTALESVTGGPKLVKIGTRAFEHCPKLKVFNISSKTLTKISPFAFNGDKSLTTLQLKNTTMLTKAGIKNSLKGSSVKTIKVKKSKVKKYKKIFKKKNCGKKVKVKK